MNYNFIWLLCYLLVLVGLAGYGFHRLTIVYLYWKNRNNKPQPKSPSRSFPWSRSSFPCSMKVRCGPPSGIRRRPGLPQGQAGNPDSGRFHGRYDGTVLPEGGGIEVHGFDAVCIHRTDRTGFKAGALEAATKGGQGGIPADPGRRFRPGTRTFCKRPFIISRMRASASSRPAGAISTGNTTCLPASRACTWTATSPWNRRPATVPDAFSRSTALPASGANA